MPDSRESLARLGVVLDESEGHLFRGIRFQNSLHRVDARFSRGAGIGVRRPHLHALLASRAEEAGARLLWNSRVQLSGSEPGADGLRTALVDGHSVRFRWLIGADGQASSVRRWAGLDGARKRSLRYGFRTHYRVAPWSDLVEVHWGRGGQLYITPVAADCVCVVFITRNPRCDRTAILSEFPEIAHRLEGAEIVSAAAWRGLSHLQAASCRNRFRRAGRRRLRLGRLDHRRRPRHLLPPGLRGRGIDPLRLARALSPRPSPDRQAASRDGRADAHARPLARP